MEDGVAASPAADSDIRNVSLYANDMLGVRTERVALVGHLLNDKTQGADPTVATGFRTQDMQVGSTSSRPVDSIDPIATNTQLIIDL